VKSKSKLIGILLEKMSHYLNIFMNSDSELAGWKNLVQEAIEGKVDIDRSMEKNLKLYGREAAQFELPKDYPEIKTAADLLAALDNLIKQSTDSIQDPLALSLLSRVKNTNPLSLSRQLDNLAKAENPEKP
jgi:hypothetical protein